MQSYCSRSWQTDDLCRLLEQIARSPRREGRGVTPALPRSAKKRSADLRAAIVAEYEAGVTVGELARMYGVHRISVSNYLDAAGVIRRPRGLTDDQVSQAVQLYKQGGSLATVGKRLGCSPHTVERTLRKLGVRLRDTHGRHS